jgi:hypothetical protein
MVWTLSYTVGKVVPRNNSLSRGDIQSSGETNATAEIAKYGVQAFPSIRIVDASGKSLIIRRCWDAASMKAFVLQNVGVIKDLFRLLTITGL